MATLKDVAELAGVSPITVSRVVNSPESVKEKTRLKVENAMSRLRYTPNLAAKNLATSRTGIIDVFVPESIDLSNPFVMHFIAGVSKVLSDNYCSFLILRNRKREHLCDGYIVTGLLKDEINEFAAYAAERNRPVVLFGHTELSDVDCIDVDNVAGARLAVERLLEDGRQNIAMVNILEDKDYTVDRLTGYKQALEAAGLPFREELLVYAPNSVDGGGKAVAELMDRGGFDGLFCATDTIAIGACTALKDLGYSIPGDISLVGFDGLGHNLLTEPHITTVQQPVYELGMMLAKRLLARLDGQNEKTTHLVLPKILPGRSTKL